MRPHVQKVIELNPVKLDMRAIERDIPKDAEDREIARIGHVNAIAKDILLTMIQSPSYGEISDPGRFGEILEEIFRMAEQFVERELK